MLFRLKRSRGSALTLVAVLQSRAGPNWQLAGKLFGNMEAKAGLHGVIEVCRGVGTPALGYTKVFHSLVTPRRLYPQTGLVMYNLHRRLDPLFGLHAYVGILSRGYIWVFGFPTAIHGCLESQAGDPASCQNRDFDDWGV